MSKQSQIRNPKSQIAIVGAGPAGASLAIRLARKGFRVRLIERESFPREKLCGEFISPECLSHFKDLGVLDEMLSAGGERILETVFYSRSGKSVNVPSEWFDKSFQGALSLSRAEMDFRLLEKAKESGVKIFENTSAVGLIFENQRVCGVKTRNESGETEEIFADLIIDATGRANVLGRLAEKEISRKGAKRQRTKDKGQRTKLVGFKAHLKNANPQKSHCEIYFFRGGYGGLSLVENNLANFCFLIKADVTKELNGKTNKIIEQIVFQNQRASVTLKDAEPVHEWLAVSVDGFGMKNLNPARRLLAVGDAGAFIDPFTGSGMLMALESAEILAKSIFENDFAPEKIAESYKILHRQRFQRRLRVCSVLRRLAFAPSLADAAISFLSLGKRPREILARATRPGDFSAEER
ncbi:MAG TPA: NAD(P)/FAD-dependent oxidoreductase [Pyrinomonadaceae bacterium]|nr:NAD(P)/FAD-dependent oxidoreductase [Pyrinomonadaceae bacterium]